MLHVFRSPVQIENHSSRVGLNYMDSCASLAATFCVWSLALLVLVSVSLLDAFENLE